MQLPLYWIDAFTDRVGAGNPAAVVPLERWPGTTAMQAIAAQNGLSETAFLVPTGPARYHLRWFTPAVEVDLCGHATLAAAFVLFTEAGLAEPAVTFDTRSGPLVVERGAEDRLVLDFPERAAGTATKPSAALLEGLGRAPAEVFHDADRWLCVFPRAEDVRGLRPDPAALRRSGAGRILATAPGDGSCDFVSRYFAPGAGIDEDPVTGSAHCTLVPYWAARLGRDRLHARQVSGRGGELWCERRAGRVRLGGRAVRYLRGELTWPDAG